MEAFAVLDMPEIGTPLPVVFTGGALPASERSQQVAALLEQSAEAIRRDPLAALHLAQRAAGIAGTAPADQAACLRALGHAHRALGHYTTALAVYDKACALFRSARLPQEADRTGLGMIDALMYLGRTSDALSLGRRLRVAFGGPQDALQRAKLEANLANIYARIQRPARALELVDAAIRSFAEAGDPLLLAQAQMNRGNMLAEMGEFVAALQAFIQARAVFSDRDMVAWIAMVDVNIGYLHAVRGFYTDALRAITGACRLFTRLNSARDLATARLDLAETYLALNLHTEAMRLATEAAHTFGATHMHHDAGRAYLIQARVSLANHAAPAEVLPLLDRAATSFSVQHHPVGQALVDFYRASTLMDSQPAAALDQVQRAEQVFASQHLIVQHGQSLLVRGALHAQTGDTAAARRVFQQARQMGERYGLPWLLAQAHYNEGKLHEQHNPSAARASYTAAIQAVEEMRAHVQPDDTRIAILRDRLAPYNDMLRLTLQDNDIPAAIHLVERARARALLDVLGESSTPAEATSSDQADLQHRLVTLRAQMNAQLSLRPHWRTNGWLRKTSLMRLRQLEQQIQEAERQTQLLDPSLAGRSVSPADLPALQASLADDQAIVSYTMLDQEVLAFVIGRHSVTLQRALTTVGDLTTLVERLRAGMERFGHHSDLANRHTDQLISTTAHHLSRLGALLIAPLTPALQQYQRLVIVPHGVLHYVPFAALRTEDGDLLDSHEIVLAPSGSVWAACQQQGTHTPPADLAQARALVLGVDDPQTPWMTHEARMVGRLLPGSKPLEGLPATAETVATHAGDCDILHLACHGVFRNDNPFFSALKLDDGWLTVHDIGRLHLRANLVTLSGCQTGRQAIGPGDDLIGLARGFFSAGARQMVVSLWMVHDDTTSQLMERFYTALRNGQRVAAALRTAQLELRATHPHPYAWAAFIAIGAR